jgi:hypothetical protein
MPNGGLMQSAQQALARKFFIFPCSLSGLYRKGQLTSGKEPATHSWRKDSIEGAIDPCL